MQGQDPLDAYRSFESRVGSLLAQSGWRYASEARIRGVEVDFLVWAPGDKTFVALELKILTHDRGQLSRRAAELALRTRDVLGAKIVFLVTPHKVAGVQGIDSEHLRLVSEAELISALQAEFRIPNPGPEPAIAEATASSAGLLFAAMPFAHEFDDVFFVGIAGAAERLGLAARRVDHEDYSGDIVARIKDSIRESSFVIADLTNQRPNVLYEMGFAHALGKLVIPLSSDDLSQLPFDVAHENTLRYQRGRTTQLRDKLTDRLGGPPGETRPVGPAECLPQT